MRVQASSRATSESDRRATTKSGRVGMRPPKMWMEPGRGGRGDLQGGETTSLRDTPGGPQGSIVRSITKSAADHRFSLSRRVALAYPWFSDSQSQFPSTGVIARRQGMTFELEAEGVRVRCSSPVWARKLLEKGARLRRPEAGRLPASARRVVPSPAESAGPRKGARRQGPETDASTFFRSSPAVAVERVAPLVAAVEAADLDRHSLPVGAAPRRQRASPPSTRGRSSRDRSAPAGSP